jgi:hypothetical protein
LLTAFSASLAQSGGASLHGWVAFEDVAYVDKQPRAKVVLQHDPPGSGPAYSTETDEHGFFEFPHTSLGRFKLEITAKGFQPYSADVYMPSDFAAIGLCSSRRKQRSDRDQATAEWFVSLSVTTDQSRCCDILFGHSERSESAVEESLAVLSSTKKLEMSRLCST